MEENLINNNESYYDNVSYLDQKINNYQINDQINDHMNNNDQSDNDDQVTKDDQYNNNFQKNNKRQNNPLFHYKTRINNSNKLIHNSMIIIPLMIVKVLVRG